MKLWIARNIGGELELFDGKPTWRKHSLDTINSWFDARFLGSLNPNEFPEVTFENSPQQVELKLVKSL